MPITGDGLVVVKPGALGDTLVLAPVLRALRQSGAGQRLTVVGSAPYIELLKLFGVADAAVAFDRIDVFGGSGRGRQWIAGRTVMSFYGRTAQDGAQPFQNLGAAAVYWRPWRPERAGVHVVTHLYQAARAWCGGLPPLSRAAFAVPPAVPPVDGRYAVIAPGAGGIAKRFPLERFRTIAEEQAAAGVVPLFVAGETEEEDGLVRRLPHEFRIRVRPAMAELAAILAGAEAVFANDSGVAHLAALVGTPTTVFFGPTDPAVWRPWGERVRVKRF
jgi:ADP-heptose:LPS heptosyltransferase